MGASALASFELEVAVRDQVEKIAAARHQTSASIMREAVEQYVDRELSREQLNAETLASLAEFRATGLHLTGDEVDQWLGRLEAGEDVQMPECHV